MLIFVKGKVGTKILLWMTDSKTRKEVTGPKTFCLVSLVQILQLFSKCVQVQAEENGQCGTPPKGWSFKRGGNGCTMSWPCPYPHQPRYGNPTHCTRDLHNHMSTHVGKQPGFPYPVTKRLYHLRDFLRIPIQWLWCSHVGIWMYAGCIIWRDSQRYHLPRATTRQFEMRIRLFLFLLLGVQ